MGDQPPYGDGVIFAHRKVQGYRVAAFRTDSRGIVLQHALGYFVALKVDRAHEIKLGAGRGEHHDDGRMGLLLASRGKRRRPFASVAFASAPRSNRSRAIRGRFFAAAWCKGARWCSFRLIRALRSDGSRAMNSRTSPSRSSAIADQRLSLAPWARRYAATSSRTRARQVAQPSTPTWWSSPSPTTSEPASTKSLMTSKSAASAAKCRG